MKRKNVGAYIASALLFLIPIAVSAAQNKGLVPICNGIGRNGQPASGPLYCTPCDLYQLVQNIINFLIQLSVPIGILLLAYAGILLFSANGDPSKITKARRIFSSAVIGLGIALSAWLLVQTFVNMLVSSTFKSGWSWNNISQYCTTDRGGINTDVTVSDWLNQTIGQGTPGSVSVGPNPPGGGGGDLFTAICAQLPQPPTQGPTINNAICISAHKYIYQSTAQCNCPGHPGGTPGNEACAYAVSQVLNGISNINTESVITMHQLLGGPTGNGGTDGILVNQANATCGDIIISQDNEHVGICLDPGCNHVISNSSTNSTFTWCSNGDFDGAYDKFGGNPTIYQVTH